jgi:transcriptional regulator with XRE-family HTH domain
MIVYSGGVTTPLGRRLRAMRQAKGWSQAALAQRATITREYVAYIEGGRSDPSVGILRKLAKALGVKPGALLD